MLTGESVRAIRLPRVSYHIGIEILQATTVNSKNRGRT